MRKTKGIAFWMACLSLLWLSSCGGGNVVLDNPRTEAVVFSFDGKDDHAVGANAFSTISLDAGQHSLIVKSNNGASLAEGSFSVKEGGLVHSGASNYIVWRQLYGLQNDRKSLLNEDWAMVDSTKFYGDFKVHPDSILFIEKNWNLGLEEKLPETQTLYVTKDYKVESKLFRQADFVATYRAMAEQSKKSKNE